MEGGGGSKIGKILLRSLWMAPCQVYNCEKKGHQFSQETRKHAHVALMNYGYFGTVFLLSKTTH